MNSDLNVKQHFIKSWTHCLLPSEEMGFPQNNDTHIVFHQWHSSYK